LVGGFNVYNALAAISVALSQGIGLGVCKKALEKAQPTPGRMEIVSKEPTVIVDYAHTPEQLENVYKTFLGKSSGDIGSPPKLICVLGSCGGGRDKWKRPVLGQIAEKYCDQIFITNEDPYDESPMEIINQVADEIKNKQCEKVLDRKEAIKKAVSMAKQNDFVIITGKGAEPWMCLENGKKIPWDDRQFAREELNNL
jgi:UDP-N-acetylmuramoyl-L-alanyl-D-glutamate--2,6-diaminopimelate ligase